MHVQARPWAKEIRDGNILINTCGLGLLQRDLLCAIPSCMQAMRDAMGYHEGWGTIAGVGGSKGVLQQPPPFFCQAQNNKSGCDLGVAKKKKQ